MLQLALLKMLHLENTSLRYSAHYIGCLFIRESPSNFVSSCTVIIPVHPHPTYRTWSHPAQFKPGKACDLQVVEISPFCEQSRCLEIEPLPALVRPPGTIFPNQFVVQRHNPSLNHNSKLIYSLKLIIKSFLFCNHINLHGIL